MKTLTAQQLRDLYFQFFASKGHTVIPSAPLVPQNDPTVLFTTAGMHPLVPYLLGQQHPGGKRVAGVQKCVRTTDIDEVGDNRHLTFFEMLGNWSFGDYFKDEAIAWSFEFLTDEKYLGIDPRNLYVSVFGGDAEVPRDEQAIEAWKKAFASHALTPVNAELSEDVHKFGTENKIFPYGRDKNWWQASDKGPAGPDSEMFVDTEGDLPENMRVKHSHWQKQTESKDLCHINCDCGRFVEIWNDVFMEYNGLGDGKYEPLKQKNIDTGMGLERVLTFLDNQSSVYDTELFSGAFAVILNEVPQLTGEQEVKAKIIVDHLRAATFMAADGVVPSNKERGYIMRRLLRRAMVHGRILGLTQNWIEKIVSGYVDLYKQQYPELEQRKCDILNVILEEEQKFSKTLEQGLKELKSIQDSGQQVTGEIAFNLYQSHGIPPEVTREFADVKNPEEFDAAFKKHQELSRTASAGAFKGGLADASDPRIVRMHTATHLLQAALRKALGDHVYQKGSNITSERLRFDFTHPEKMTAEQIAAVEEEVNKNIQRDLKVQKDIMTPDQARGLGAIGLFGEKYGDTVSIYTISDPSTGEVVSREFCGGPHVEHTAEIGKFKIQKEEAVSAGVRRIKATVE